MSNLDDPRQPDEIRAQIKEAEAIAAMLQEDSDDTFATLITLKSFESHIQVLNTELELALKREAAQ